MMGTKISFGNNVSISKFTKNTLNGYNAFINGKVYLSGNKISKTDLLFENNKIIEIGDLSKTNLGKEITLIDIKNKILTPAIVDQHIHGGFGLNFNNASKSQIENYLKELKKYGYGEILATMVPDNIKNLITQIKAIGEIIKNPPKNATKIFGINLEGPFFNPQKSGIHPPEILMKPSVENFKKIETNDIKMVTVAPELDEDYKLIEYLNSKGIITSAGHTAASAQETKNSNVKQITHLFNAMSPIHHRNLSVTNEGLTNDKIFIELNSDLNLVAADMINLTLRAKPKDKIILISDALEGTKMKADKFYMNNVKINIINDKAINAKGTLAGSIKLLSEMAYRLVKETNMSFADFIRYSSINPAKNLGIEEKYQISRGKSPNFIIWDEKTLKPEKTFIV